MRNDVCITMTVMSLDLDCSPEIAGMIGFSGHCVGHPWNGPIGGVQVGLVDGQIVLNPHPGAAQGERPGPDHSRYHGQDRVMIEAGANEVDEDTMLNAIKAAHVEIKKIIEFINRIVAERGKKKIDFRSWVWTWTCSMPSEQVSDDFKATMDTDDKNVRDAALLPIADKIAEEYPDLSAADLDLVRATRCRSSSLRRWLLDEGVMWTAAALTRSAAGCQVGILPRVHGSGMFTRGQTQVLTTTPWGGTGGQPLMDDLDRRADQALYPPLQLPAVLVGEACAPPAPAGHEIVATAPGRACSGACVASLEEFPTPSAACRRC